MRWFTMVVEGKDGSVEELGPSLTVDPMMDAMVRRAQGIPQPQRMTVFETKAVGMWEPQVKDAKIESQLVTPEGTPLRSEPEGSGGRPNPEGPSDLSGNQPTGEGPGEPVDDSRGGSPGSEAPQVEGP